MERRARLRLRCTIGRSYLDLDSSGHGVARPGAVLYVPTLALPIAVDGHIADWLEQDTHSTHYDEDQLLESADLDVPPTLAFAQRVGKYDQYLYAVFQVTDDRVVFRSSASQRAKQVDHLELLFATPSAEARHYCIALDTGSKAFAESISANSASYAEPRIAGAWRTSASGYVLEVRVSLELLGPRLGFAIADVDTTDSGAVASKIGNASSVDLHEMPSIVIPGSEIDAILRAMERTSARIWVVDHAGRVLARAGSLGAARRIERNAEPARGALASAAGALQAATLQRIYAKLLRPPSEVFEDGLMNVSSLAGKELERTFMGATATRWRLTRDKRALILSAAQPIWIGDRVAGAVVVEETTNAILTLRNRALEQLFNVALIVFALGSLTLFCFASRLSRRIRRLRDQAEHAIDSQGRVSGAIASAGSGDEINDLARSFDDILQRLREYVSYLEAMANRLSHELKTPVAIVQSSLDNLSSQPLPPESAIYVERAQQGVTRLGTLLTRMSEARRLEEVMQGAERERFDLRAVVEACVRAYQSAYPTQRFALELPQHRVHVHGVPDLIAQMLDKLAANALDFTRAGTPISISLSAQMTTARVRVINDGPPLPTQMEGRLFESMISIRPASVGSEPHLGLGLFIVRLIAEFHRGHATLANRRDGEGVVATITLSTLDPITR